MFCITYDKNQKLKLTELPTPTINNDEALLKLDVCGVCGSDLVKIKKWSVGQKVVVAHHAPCLNCYFCRSGNFSMCEQFKKTNLDPGGFSEYIKLSKFHLEQTAFLIPKSTISDYEIALTEPLACCIRAVRKAQVGVSHTVLICGLGSIGIMLGKICIQKGAHTFGIDLLEDRINLAKDTLSIHNGYLASSSELKSWILNKTEGRGVDIVFLASGSSKSLDDALSLVRSGGKIVIFSSIEQEKGYYNNEIYYRELTILGSYSPSPSSLKEAYEQIITGKIKLKHLITDVVSLKELPTQIEKCFENKSLKMMVAT